MRFKMLLIESLTPQVETLRVITCATDSSPHTNWKSLECRLEV